MNWHLEFISNKSTPTYMQIYRFGKFLTLILFLSFILLCFESKVIKENIWQHTSNLTWKRRCQMTPRFYFIMSVHHVSRQNSSTWHIMLDLTCLVGDAPSDIQLEASTNFHFLISTRSTPKWLYLIRNNPIRSRLPSYAFGVDPWSGENLNTSLTPMTPLWQNIMSQ